MLLNGIEERQVGALVAAIDAVLADNIVGLYLYGSAVAGQLRPGSDLDLLAVVREPTSRAQRLDLARTLRQLSRRGERPPEWRPIELTVVVHSDVKPLRVPPRTDFQYGEWLRSEMDAGEVDPSDPENPDLLVVLAQVRRTSRPLRGPEAADVIAAVQTGDLRAAMLRSVDGLLSDLESDTTNVLLTMARIWVTLETGDFVAKDEAAAWAAARIDDPARNALRHAADVYRGDADEDWSAGNHAPAATQLVEAIGRA
jgi:streptomycin 3"-adenylyltransferase